MEGLENVAFLNKEAFAQKPDREKEKELALRFQKGDLQAYHELRRTYEPLITNWAIQKQPPSKEVSLAQIKARAYAEFPKLIMKYDPEKGQLNTHLFNHLPDIMGNVAMDDMIGPHIPRTQQPKLNRYKQALRTAKMEHGNNVTDEQVFDVYKDNNPDKTWEDFLEAKKYLSSSAIGDIPMGTDDGEGTLRLKDKHTGMSVLEDRDDPYRLMELDHIKDIMRQHLDPVEFNVINQHKIEGQPMARVALNNNMSTTRLRSIVDKWEKIRKENNIK